MTLALYVSNLRITDFESSITSGQCRIFPRTMRQEVSARSQLLLTFLSGALAMQAPYWGSKVRKNHASSKGLTIDPAREKVVHWFIAAYFHNVSFKLHWWSNTLVGFWNLKKKYWYYFMIIYKLRTTNYLTYIKKYDLNLTYCMMQINIFLQITHSAVILTEDGP